MDGGRLAGGWRKRMEGGWRWWREAWLDGGWLDGGLGLGLGLKAVDGGRGGGLEGWSGWMESWWMEGWAGLAGGLRRGSQKAGWSVGGWRVGGWLEGCRSWIEGWMEEGWREVLGGLDGGRLEGGMDGVKCGSVRAVRFCVSVQRFAVFAVHRVGRFLAFSVPVCGSVRGLPEKSQTPKPQTLKKPKPQKP